MKCGDIGDYESRVNDFKRVLQQLLVKYDSFRGKHLSEATDQHRMSSLIDNEFITLLNSSKLKVNANTITNDEADSKIDSSTVIASKSTATSVTNTNINNLLKCLIIVEYFDGTYDNDLQRYLGSMKNECIEYIKQNEFEYVASFCRLMDDTIAKGVDLKLESLGRSLRFGILKNICNTVKQELKNALQSQVSNVKALVTNIGNNDINNSNEKVALIKLESEYNAICRSCERLEQQFINDNVVDPNAVKDEVNQLLSQHCQSIQVQIETKMKSNSDKYEINNTFAAIRYLVSIINQLTKIIDNKNTIDNILVKVLTYLIDASKDDLKMIIEQLEWILQYHSNKSSLVNVFQSILSVVSTEISDLNQLIMNDGRISVREITTSTQAVENIVNQILTIRRRVHDLYQLFYDKCDIENVNTLVGKLIDTLRKRIETIVEHVFGIQMNNDSNESKTDTKDSRLVRREIEFDNEFEVANDCLELLEKCKIWNDMTIVKEETLKKVESHLKQRGMSKCNAVKQGLQYFQHIFDNLDVKLSLSLERLMCVDEYARRIASFGDIKWILDNHKYKLVRKYMFVDQDVGSLRMQWKNDIWCIYAKLNRNLEIMHNSSTTVSSSMIICKALTIVDDCGILEQYISFASLTKKIESLIDDECQELIKYIDDRDFGSVKQQFEKQQQQLLVGGKYSFAREYLVKAMFSIENQLISMIAILPSIKINDYLNTRENFQQLIAETKQIMEFGLIKYVDDASKDEWYRNIKQILDHAQTSSSKLLDCQELQYNQIQSNIEVLQDFESKLIELKEYQEIYNSETSENNVKRLIVKVQQRLDQDCKKFDSFDIKDYHCESQPSKICKILLAAAHICNSFRKPRVLQKSYQQAKEHIEKSFQTVFYQECNSIMQVEKDFYQHHKRVVVCWQLCESLISGPLESAIKEAFTEMAIKHCRLRKDEDDKVWEKTNSNTTRFMDMVLATKNDFFSISTHKSKLRDLNNVYQEYLQRMKYGDMHMTPKLQKFILDKIGDECKEIEECVSNDRMFNVDSSSVSNLHDRIDELKKVITDILQDDECGEELRTSISHIIVQAYTTIDKNIQGCPIVILKVLNKMDVLCRWFAHTSRNNTNVQTQNNYVEKLATYILRVMNGFVYYHSVLVDILPYREEKIDEILIRKIKDILNQYFDTWTVELERMIASSEFGDSVPYLEIVAAFENSKLMNQVRHTIGDGLNQFSCGGVSIMVKKYMKIIQDQILDEGHGFFIVDGDVSRSIQMRIEHYKQLHSKLHSLFYGEQLEKYLNDYKHNEFTKPCISLIVNEVKKARVECELIIKTLEQAEAAKEEQFRKVNHIHSDLTVLKKFARFHEYISGTITTSLRIQIKAMLKMIGKQASSRVSTLTQIKESMIKLQMAKHILTDSEFQDLASHIMERAVLKQRKKHGILTLSGLFTDALSVHLQCNPAETQDSDAKLNDKDNFDNKDDNYSYWCKEIINSFPIFSGAVIHLFNTKHGKNAKDIDSAIEKMLVGKTGNVVIDDNEKKMLKSLYESFDNKYWQLINEYIVHGDIKKDKGKTFEMIRSKITILMNKNYKRCDMIVELMAHIFCVWTLLDCKHFLAMKKQHDDYKSKSTNTISVDQQQHPQLASLFDWETCKSYLRQPKATQILAIMRLLGINGSFDSNLIEIKTGEGKSLVLAASACIIALLGYNIYCVCYGELLTKRDYNEFRDLFIQLRVESKIRYAMYSEVCEALISGMNIVDGVQYLLSDTSKYKSTEKIDKPKDGTFEQRWRRNNTVLLIDEVDVLFDTRYCGSTYNEITPLKHKCISQMTDTIWSWYNERRFGSPPFANPDRHNKKPDDMEMIKKTKEYRDCEQIFGKWMPLIDQHVKHMIKDVKSLMTHQYILHNDQIGYYQEDTVCFRTRYGYKTMFAYYKEQERNHISKKTLENAKKIDMRHSCISYAELPCQFMCIAGVTGTLSELETSRKDFLQTKYKINKYTYIATMFKENQLIFDTTKDVTVVENDSWAKQVKDEIDTRMAQTKQRPVFVFFETNSDLQKFIAEHGAEYNNSNVKLLILNEKLTVNEKMKVIKDACRLNTITLCTRIFGRGTDFIVTDDRVNALGGPHVIQTFFSWDISEEIQIKGRTARNGGNGTFSMVLNGSKHWHDFAEKEKQPKPDWYDDLCVAREKLRKEVTEAMVELVENSKVYHEKTLELAEHIQQKNDDEVLKSLQFFEFRETNE